MTRSAAREIARKTVNERIANRQILTLKQYRDLVDDETETVFTSRRVVMLSEKFDAPQFAREFLQLARDDGGRDLVVRAYTKISGEYCVSGRPRMHWTEVKI